MDDANLMGGGRRFSVSLPEGEMTGWRWENSSAPPLLFLHATGFCASIYIQMLSALSDRYDIYALDQRGHGLNSLPADPASLRSWRVYRDDARAVLDQLGRGGWTLAGHSMGAAVSVLAAEGRADIAALKLIEPVAMPLWLTVLAKSPVWPFLSERMSMVRQAARRRSFWADRDGALSSYARKPFFQGWAAGVLEDYLKDGVKETADGVVLSCAPEWEAATFAAQANDFWKAVANAPAPVSVFAAREAVSTAPAFARARFQKLGAMVTVDDKAGHLAPMQNPPELAAFLAV